MNTNKLSILQLEVPFCVRPRFFIPPISGNKIRAAMLNDVSSKFWAPNVCGFVSIQQNRRRFCRPKSSQRWPWHRHPADRMGWKPIPQEWLNAKRVRPMSLFQNRRADSISPQKSDETGERF
jgi:hypothetical protein